MNIQKLSLVATRVVLGCMFFYAGITKVLDPKWSAGGYIQAAKTFPALFKFFASPGILPVVNLVNEWGLVLLGVSLILGALVRWSAPLGALLMLLYYLAALDFPYPNAHAFIVDEHIIYIALLVYLASIGAGKTFGLDRYLSRRK